MLLPILPLASFESNDLDFFSDGFESNASSFEFANLLLLKSLNPFFTAGFSPNAISFSPFDEYLFNFSSLFFIKEIFAPFSVSSNVFCPSRVDPVATVTPSPLAPNPFCSSVKLLYAFHFALLSNITTSLL